MLWEMNICLENAHPHFCVRSMYFLFCGLLMNHLNFLFQDLILENNELRYRLTELESEKQQYEKKLKTTKVGY